MTMIGFPGQRSDLPWRERRIAPVMSTGGMVASAHPMVSSAGLRVLAAGGNAVDAAVSAALTASVCLPDMCGLGGDIFAIVHDPRQSRPVSYLGSGIAPRGLTYEMAAMASPGGTLMPEQGPLSIGVPGMVRGYRDLLKNHGSKSFEELVQPALGYAERGHPMGRGEADHLGPAVGLLEKLESTRAVFLPDGKPIRTGEFFIQSGLASTFRRLIEAGLDDFYEGELARQIASSIQACGGVLSTEDLADHETTVTEPISVEYRGYRINQTGLPSQGMIHLEALRIADHALGAEPFWTDTAIHRQIESIKLAFADRLGYAQDPKTGDTPLDVLLSDEWARKRACEIGDCAATSVSAGTFQDGDTTYLCVVDGDGMMVSLIQSVSNAFGSGVIAGETGIVMNNRIGRGFTLDTSHPNVYAPGKRTMHTLNCFSIEQLDGTPVLVGGTPGGDGQPQWNLAMVSGLIDGKLDVQQVTEMPRWTVWPGTDPTGIGNPFELRLEDAFGPAMHEALARRGHKIKAVAGWHGAAQIIARDPETGVIVGGSDPRVEGQAIGL
jgi:gamma-glutamyltranspeptidase/glutathione hydrolase